VISSSPTSSAWSTASPSVLRSKPATCARGPARAASPSSTATSTRRSARPPSRPTASASCSPPTTDCGSTTGRWLDLTAAREVHTIVVCLDDFGPAALMLDELVRNGTLTQIQLPWIVSLHDLLVCADVLDDPSPFLTYLRRRTSHDAALWVTAVDELDILMWFVDGGFHFEPDPDRLHARRPQGRPPTVRDRRRYADQGRTDVGTFTDDLDAWCYAQEGSSSRAAPRPRRSMNPLLQVFSDRLREAEAPGWWRTGSDLDGLADQAQHRLADGMRLTIPRARANGQFHTFTTSGSGDTGGWLLILAVADDTRSRGTISATT